MVRSRFAWLSYHEPEAHLDALVERLTLLPGVGPETVIGGLTYKDDSTLARLQRLGLPRTWRLDPAEDLGLDDPAVGLETLQSALREDRTRPIAACRGQVGVLIVRHLLEHAHDPRAFLRGLAPLVRPGGYVVCELPDCRKFLDACDYSFVWEEHVAYFSPATLRALFESNGCEVLEILTYSYPLEDSLVVVARVGSAAVRAVTAGLEAELARGRRFAARFSAVRERYRAHLAALRSAGKRVAIFGAGHLAAVFLNLFDLADYLECVVDDDPDKQGLLMPGSRLPIHGAQALADRRIDLCLLSLSPESEKKVLAANRAFLDRGGEFRSIFASSPRALQS